MELQKELSLFEIRGLLLPRPHTISAVSMCAEYIVTATYVNTWNIIAILKRRSVVGRCALLPVLIVCCVILRGYGELLGSVLPGNIKTNPPASKTRCHAGFIDLSVANTR